MGIQNSYTTTLNGMVQNYAETGIFYFQGIYKTLPNNSNDLIEYEVEILWYCLSPCPNFYSSLSLTNKDIINHMYNIPNVCTMGPIFNDCNFNNIGQNGEKFYENCTNECIQTSESYIFDILTNLKNIQKISYSQALIISSLTAWVTRQIFIPFITGNYGVAIEKNTLI